MLLDFKESKINNMLVSYILYSAVSSPGIFYGGCLGLPPPSATVRSILAIGDWIQISDAENREAASFYWAAT